MTYEDMDAVELRAELERWTLNVVDQADLLVDAIDAQDMIRAAFIAHRYKQAKWQLRKVRKAMQIGVA